MAIMNGMQAGLLLAGLALTLPAAAQNFPARPISILHASTSGSGPDTFLRMANARMGETLGQPVNVEARPGGGGTVSAVAVKQAAPDGYTLLFNHSGNMVMDPVLGAMPFDPTKDFRAIALGYYTLAILFVPGSSPAKTVAEFVALARSNPQGLFFGTASTSSDLIVAMIAHATGTKLLSVPYKGQPQILTDLASARLDFAISTLQPTSRALIDAGKLRVLAVAWPKRLESFPNYPTMIEQGVPVPRSLTWFGLFAPAGTPDGVVRMLHREFNAAFSRPEVRDMLAKDGSAALTLTDTPEEFGRIVRNDLAAIDKLIKDTGFKLKP